jgi:mono/diheme cytochrome c family protein
VNTLRNRNRNGNVCLLVLFGFGALSAAGCRGETSAQTPFLPERNMYQQQRYNPQARSAFFTDHRTMRKPMEHTIPQEMNVDPEISDGELADGSGYVLTLPNPVVAQLGGLESAAHRGQDRYNIYCRPCHDGSGSGQGTVIKRGMSPPPSLHDDRIRHMPDGQLFATISHGVRNMPAYNYSIPTNDRWAIVSYVRALELSQTGE